MNTQTQSSHRSFFAAAARIGLRLALLAGLFFLAPGVSAISPAAPPPKPKAYMVKDINPGLSGPSYFQVIHGTGSTLYFVTDDGQHGHELWKSDGTAVGTQLVKDIYPGRYASDIYEMASVNDTLYFTANDGVHGNELWKSDGTTAGTQLVKDIFPGSGGSGPYSLTVLGNTLFFLANDGVHGEELWRSDGTAAGTLLVSDIYPGVNGSDARYLTLFNHMLILVAEDGTHGSELWKSDGSEAGTQLVKDICPGACDSMYTYDGISFTALDHFLLFGANDGVHGNELWRTDGTLDGTSLVKDISPGSSSSLDLYDMLDLGVLDGAVFFPADDGTLGYELWKSDGSEAGTQLVKEIRPSYLGSYPKNFALLDNMLFFAADDGELGQELWRSDGSEAGTELVKDIYPGSYDSNINDYHSYGIVPFNGRLYFSASHPAYGMELWWSDGTQAGTELLADLYPGMGSSYPEFLTVANGKLFFFASDLSFYDDRRALLNEIPGPFGRELWSLAYFSYLPAIYTD